jgi:hypothetical protein
LRSHIRFDNSLTKESFIGNGDRQHFNIMFGCKNKLVSVSKNQMEACPTINIESNIKLKMSGRVDESDPTHYFDRECCKYLDHPLIEYLGELGMDDKLHLLSRAI